MSDISDFVQTQLQLTNLKLRVHFLFKLAAVVNVILANAQFVIVLSLCNSIVLT